MDEKASKHVLVCGSPCYGNRDAIREILQKRIRYGDIVYTFRRDGACHLAETWLRSRRIPCFALPLPKAIPKRQAVTLELVSVVDVVVLFGKEDDVSNYIFRLARLAKRTIYLVKK